MTEVGNTGIVRPTTFTERLDALPTPLPWTWLDENDAQHGYVRRSAKVKGELEA